MRNNSFNLGERREVTSNVRCKEEESMKQEKGRVRWKRAWTRACGTEN